MESAGDNSSNSNIVTRLLSKVKFDKSDIILTISVVIMVIISFNLGKTVAFKEAKTPVSVYQQDESGQLNRLVGQSAQIGNKIAAPTPVPKDYSNTPVYASKNSTGKLYHFPWCSSANSIAEKNKITFVNETAAKVAGYSLAGNCKR